MKSFLKRVSHKLWCANFTQAMFTCIAYLYIRLVFVTSHWQYQNRETIEGYINQNKPFILAFWHGHLLMMACSWQWLYPFNMLISFHRDGQLIAKIIGRFGIRTIYGSTNRQGFNAARQIVSKIKQGEVIGVTPDGPRGPREQVSDGILQLARLADVDIIPIAYATTNMKKLTTWDHFRLAKPFGKGVFVVGKPVPPSKDLGQAKVALYRELQETVRAADSAAHSG